MNNKISSLILAILLVVIFWGSASNYFILMAAVALLVIAVSAVNLKRVSYSWPHLLLPVLFLLAAGGIFAIFTSPQLRLWFLLLAGIIFYLIETNLGKEGYLLQTVFLLSSFALYVGLFSLHFYLRLNPGLLAVLSFFLTGLLAITGFAGFSQPAKKYFILLIAAVCAEITLALAYWPTYFMVNAVILFCIFYLLWIFAVSAFFGKLTKEKIFLQLTMIGLVLIIVLSTATWTPLFK